MQKLKNPTPGMRETLNLIAEGAGSQDPAVMLSLAEAARQLQQGLGAVSALVQRVEALEGQEKVSQGSIGKLGDQIQNLTGQLIIALDHLEAAEEETRKKPKGLFGGRG